jgi:hypothetical protein
MVRERKFVLVVKVRGGWFKIHPLITNMDEQEKHFAEVVAKYQEGNPNDLVLARKIRCTKKDPEDVAKVVLRKFNAKVQNGWIKGKISDISREIKETDKK